MLPDKKAPDHINISATSSPANIQEFILRQFANSQRTTSIGRVTAVNPGAGVAPVGFVTVQPMISQIDGAGNVVDHAPIPNVPYLRLQGGANAIILDPKVGDIGILSFGERDNTVIKRTRKPGAPGSSRKFHLSDALYHGGILNGTPTQYVQFTDNAINITAMSVVTINAPTATVNSANINLKAQTAITLTAPAINLNGNVSGGGEGGGNATFSGNITAANVTAGGIGFTGHKHPGVQAGGDTTGGPQN